MDHLISYDSHYFLKRECIEMIFYRIINTLNLLLLKVSSQQIVCDIQTVPLMRGTLILLRTSCPERIAEKT